jgi:hypothetical protein
LNCSPVDRASHVGGALQFYFYDTPKVLMLLTGVVLTLPCQLQKHHCPD